MKICRNLSDLALAFAEARALVAQGKPVAVTVKEHSNRSLDQNALAFEWYSVLSMALPDNTAQEWRNYCKLHFAVPIARAELPEFREVYDRAIKPHQYEVKLKIMEFLPVTSLLDKKQFTRYLDAVQRHFSEIGVVLEASK